MGSAMMHPNSENKATQEHSVNIHNFDKALHNDLKSLMNRLGCHKVISIIGHL